MWDWVSKLHELTIQNISVAIVTVTDTGGSSPRNSGAKMLVLEDSTIFGTIGGGQFEKQVIEQAVKCIKENKCDKYTFNLAEKSGQCCGGVVEVFIETLGSHEQLIVFGAGHVGLAVVETMSGTPFKVHLLDMHHSPWQESFQQAYDENKNNYIVIMTHSHQLDEEILESLIDVKAKYLGIIGSKNKWQRFQKRLIDKGITKQQLQNVKCPIGIKLLGKAPKEVAISLAAELLDIFYHQVTPNEAPR
jgi:xanthine dehydrogenase accessory factor